MHMRRRRFHEQTPSNSSTAPRATPTLQMTEALKKKRKSHAMQVKARARGEFNVPAYELRISNVVCTAWVGKAVSLRKVQLVTQGRLDVSVFPSSVSRARAPSTTNSLFDTGRILITGAPSVDCALYACMLFVDKINRTLNEDLQVLNFTVQNIVSSFSLGFALNVDLFYRDQKCTKLGHSQYDPSLFRGCSWRVRSGLVFVVFASGRVVLTGARSWEDAYKAYQDAVPLLERYRLGAEYKKFDATYKRTRDVDVGFAQ